jgi:hypothetical protein
MFKKLIIGTIYAIIGFCVISYITVMASLFESVGELSKKPVTNIGYPFKYYYQFWLRDSDSPNCGWYLNHFMYDCLITWIIVVLIYFLLTKNRKTSSFNS